MEAVQDRKIVQIELLQMQALETTREIERCSESAHTSWQSVQDRKKALEESTETLDAIDELLAEPGLSDCERIAQRRAEIASAIQRDRVDIEVYGNGVLNHHKSWVAAQAVLESCLQKLEAIDPECTGFRDALRARASDAIIIVPDELQAEAHADDPMPAAHCGCSYADHCPIGKSGMATRCTHDGLRAAGFAWDYAANCVRKLSPHAPSFMPAPKETDASVAATFGITEDEGNGDDLSCFASGADGRSVSS